MLLGRSAARAHVAVVLLDLHDGLLKVTDSSALQAAKHQAADLLQPWEHRHVCVEYVRTCMLCGSGGQRGAETGPVGER